MSRSRPRLHRSTLTGKRRLAGLVVVLALAGCDHHVSSRLPAVADPTPLVQVAGWHRVADAPVRPRANAVAVRVGHRVLLIGGEEPHPSCPGQRGCMAGLMTDAASLDLRTGQWTQIADLPGDAMAISSTVVGDHVFLTGLGATGQKIYDYDATDDTWSELHPAQHTFDGANLGSAHGLLWVSHPGYQDDPTWAATYDPASGDWSILPSPYLRGYYLWGVWPSPRGVIAVESLRHSSRPVLARLVDGSWRAQPDTAPANASASSWMLVRHRLLGTGGAGNSKPLTLELRDLTWHELPEGPFNVLVHRVHGKSWEVPALPPAVSHGFWAASAWVGRGLLVVDDHLRTWWNPHPVSQYAAR